MSSFSQYMFQRNFNNTGFLTKNQAQQFGVANTKFEIADKNGDNKISIEEILANEEICADLMAQINNVNSVLNTMNNKIASLQNKFKETVEQAKKGEISIEVGTGKIPHKAEKTDEAGGRVPQDKDDGAFERGGRIKQFAKDFKAIFDDMSGTFGDKIDKSFAKDIGKFMRIRA